VSDTFRALVLRSADGRAVTSAVESVDADALPAGDVVVDVEWSDLNYKDGLILTGQGRLVRDYPHVPGIDLAGTVRASGASGFAAGDRVILTGFRVGETHWGGYAERARVRSEWLVACPDGLSTRDAMVVGTAGFTAMQAIHALEAHGLTPGAGEVLVTGAAGGVGSMAVHLLARLGYTVAASTGRPETEGYLRELGATTIVSRAELAEAPTKPLLGARWAGCVDAVGGTTLAHVVHELDYGASVAACGLAGGAAVPVMVTPFLLRGVNLLGIDSVMCPLAHRVTLWNRVAGLVDAGALAAMTTVVGLGDLAGLGPSILAGQVRGRTVVDTAR
jgi:acrylyl-CoA reductase (NADPH)